MKQNFVKLFSDNDYEKLIRLSRGRNTAQKVVLRTQIILKRLEGLRIKTISKVLKTTRSTVYLWSDRYVKGGIAALLKDAPRPGRHPIISPEKEKAIVEATLHGKPKNATHWSTRTLAGFHGVSRMAVQRIWKKYQLKPFGNVIQFPNFFFFAFLPLIFLLKRAKTGKEDTPKV